MLDGTDETLVATVDRWLAAFEGALKGPDTAPLAALFHADGHWRDLLAFTWHITTVSGAPTIRDELMRHAAAVGAAGFTVDRQRTPPRRVKRVGREVIEAIFRFETALGRANGVLRLVPDRAQGGALKAWILLTALDEIKGCEEPLGDRRPKGESYSRDFRGPNWLDQRQSAAAYQGRDPTVLVVGGGQAGLAIGARLGQLNVDALIVDRERRIGDNWRNRYHALTLHNQVHVNHLPYMPFPPNWPTYIPKDKLAGWFEAYVDSMELNYWTGTEFSGGTYDQESGRWTVELNRGEGKTRTVHPRHIVVATGVSSTPIVPEIPGLANFGGRVVHSSQYGDSTEWKGRNALVFGTGNSGHDIAQDLQSNGANVTIVQRSPTLIVSIEPSGQLAYALYGEGPPLDDCDLLAMATPFEPLKQAHRMLTTQSRILDKPLLDGLERAGFKLDVEDDLGWQFKYLQRGGGYYFNVGCSDLIADGKIKVVQYSDLAGFVGEGARMRGGDLLRAELIVLATGYWGQEHLVRKLFGADVADRVGPIWGFGAEDQELRNMWVRTGQPGLWFIAGSLAQCRIFSKYLALQIRACEEGLIPALRQDQRARQKAPVTLSRWRPLAAEADASAAIGPMAN
ncbi:MAG: NAD(P)/FAD-dependent oxidoreductase [Alphaproteobacteria bacterium]|nr:NAD(P)/FAD-dependent oxidoreductase [Alphaproteobacteria bacterium]